MGESKYDFLYDSVASGVEDKKESKYDFLYDSRTSKVKTKKPTSRNKRRSSYSAARSGTVDFVESALGVGDEFDAVVRLLSGQASNWKSAIGQSRADLDRFERENPNASKILTGLGFGAALFVPGAAVAKLAQTGTKLQRAAKGAGLTAVEGAAYGFLSGEGEEGRATGAALGAGLGGVLGGVSGGLLTKNADEIKEAAEKLRSQSQGSGSFIGGKDGFVNVGRASETSINSLVKDVSASLQKQKIRFVSDEVPIPDLEVGGQTKQLGNIFLTTKEWIVKNVGERAAKLAEDAEIMIRHEQRQIDEIFDTSFLKAAELFDNDIKFKTAAVNINKSRSKTNRVSWQQFSQLAKNPEQKLIVKQLEEQTKVIQAADFFKKAGKFDYFPTVYNGPKVEGTKANTNLYENPVLSLKFFAEDVSASRALAARFGIDVDKLEIPKEKPTGNQSRLNFVIDTIEQRAKDQGASKDVAANLANGLRSQLIASKKGGNTVGAVARRTTSAAILANPLNAVLNFAEGITAPIYQNGIAAWSKTLPKAVLATFNKEFGAEKGWMSNKTLGLDREFMGEVANTGKKAMNDAVDAAQYTTLNSKIGRGFVEKSDALNKFLYRYSGVQTVNTMGQEILSNSAIQRGIDLATNGSKKSLDKLRKHDGMRGLTESEFKSTVEALKNKDLSNSWIINFAGSSMNKWQPVSASAMPKAFHDNPNGRMAYSMLSYMNKQMNGLRTDVGLNIIKAGKKGLNTKEGAEAAKEAMLNSAKYAALFGVVAGVWDDFRKTLDLSKDKDLEDLMTPEGFSSSVLNQLASNMSSGIVDIRAEEYGGQPVEVYPAPLKAAYTLGSGLFTTGKRALTGEDEKAAPLLRSLRTYAPGVANVDRLLRTTTGERLFEDLLD